MVLLEQLLARECSFTRQKWIYMRGEIPPPDYLGGLWILLCEQEKTINYTAYFREAELLNT